MSSSTTLGAGTWIPRQGTEPSSAIIQPIYRCPRRTVPDFGRVFLMLKYTDITQNTYVQSGAVTEIMAREV